jgi:hypothetical protein
VIGRAVCSANASRSCSLLVSTTGFGKVLAKATMIVSVAEIVPARPAHVRNRAPSRGLWLVHVPYLAGSEQPVGVEVTTVAPGQCFAQDNRGNLRRPVPAPPQLY